MKPKSVVTCLPTENLDRALDFYRGCFRLEGLVVEEGMIVIELGNLSLFIMGREPYEQYTSKIGLQAGFAQDGLQVLHSCAIDKASTIEHIFSTSEQFGGSVAQPMLLNEWGQHAGYVRDPDGHVWEIVLVASSE